PGRIEVLAQTGHQLPMCLTLDGVALQMCPRAHFHSSLALEESYSVERHSPPRSLASSCICSIVNFGFSFIDFRTPFCSRGNSTKPSTAAWRSEAFQEFASRVQDSAG